MQTWNPTYGVTATVDDHGDTTTTNDDVCTRHSYTFPSSGAYLIDFPNRVESVGVNCATTPAYPADAVSDVRSYYDNAAAHTTAPTVGNVTRVDAVTSYTGSTPNPVRQSTTVYDGRGRSTSIRNGLDHESTLIYTHNAAGLLATMMQRNPLSHEQTVVYEPARGMPLTVTDANGKVTTGSYDPLGRLLKVWRPGHPTSGVPDVEYQYTMQQSPASFIRTRVLGPNGNQIDSYEMFDGLLMPRQTQVTSPSGKRTITDTVYDTRALPLKTSFFHDATSAPNATLVSGVDTSIARQARYTYDGAARQLTDELWSNNVFRWKSTTVYGGDRTAVIPPTGGTVTQDVVDARGQVMQRLQYPGPGLTGTPHSTSYVHDDAGNLTSITDPAGNAWTYSNDLVGRKTQAVDPDTGTSTWTHDLAGRMATSKDGRDMTLAYAHDNLGRTTELRDNSLTGTLRANCTYDPASAKGQLATSTRYEAGLAYVTTVNGYNDFYQPTGSSVTIPASTANGALAGTYTTSQTYKTNGALATLVVPAAGNLPAETLTYGYTTQGLASTTTSGLASYVSSTSYAFDGLLTQQLLGSSGKRVKLTSAFDAATRRLTQQTTQTESATVGTYTSHYSTDFTYDQAGNRTAAAGRTNTGSGLVADQKECFRYDFLRRMTTAWTQTSGNCTTPQRTGADPYWRTFAFDTIGNRLTQVDKDAVLGDTTWTSVVRGRIGQAAPGQEHQRHRPESGHTDPHLRLRRLRQHHLRYA